MISYGYHDRGGPSHWSAGRCADGAHGRRWGAREVDAAVLVLVVVAAAAAAAEETSKCTRPRLDGYPPFASNAAMAVDICLMSYFRKRSDGMLSSAWPSVVVPCSLFRLIFWFSVPFPCIETEAGSKCGWTSCRWPSRSPREAKEGAGSVRCLGDT